MLQAWQFQWILKLQKNFIYKIELDSVLAPIIINKFFHLVLHECPVGHLKTNSFL